MKVITAPSEVRDYSIFLAGGITGCPDWQSEIIEKFSAHKDLIDTQLTLINPRRPVMPEGSDEARNQIVWEFRRLWETNAVLFWFPMESVCPISLFELGKCLMMTTVPIFVGADLQYKRRFDLLVQIPLHRPEITVADSLDQLVAQVLALLLKGEGKDIPTN